MIKIGKCGYLYGYDIEILDAYKWGKTWVYKVRFTRAEYDAKWIEYLTAKDLKGL